VIAVKPDASQRHPGSAAGAVRDQGRQSSDDARTRAFRTFRGGAESAAISARQQTSTLRDRWREWRNRLLADPRFQRFAMSFPLTRPIAKKKARAAFDLCAGFVYAQILLACVRLGLLELLAAPRTLAEIEAATGLPSDAARRLIDAAVALDLAEPRSGGRYGLGEQGASIRARPGIAAMVEHHALLYADLADPVALLRGSGAPGRLAPFWPYASEGPRDGLGDADVADYSALMAQSQSLIAGEVLDAYDFSRHRKLMDVGGGEGVFLVEVARRTPHLKLVLADLPPVAARGAARFEAAGIAPRAEAIGVDFLTDELPHGADIVSLVRVLHDQDDARAEILLAKIRASLAPGGVVLIAEPLARTPGYERMGAAYFGFYLLAMGRGRPRSFEEIAELLRSAGFHGVRGVKTRTPLQTSLILGQA
jgi:demethylspheroidene O-methyltransferase